MPIIEKYNRIVNADGSITTELISSEYVEQPPLTSEQKLAIRRQKLTAIFNYLEDTTAFGEANKQNLIASIAGQSPYLVSLYESYGSTLLIDWFANTGNYSAQNTGFKAKSYYSDAKRDAIVQILILDY